MAGMCNPKTFCFEQEFEAILPGSSIAQSGCSSLLNLDFFFQETLNAVLGQL